MIQQRPFMDNDGNDNNNEEQRSLFEEEEVENCLNKKYKKEYKHVDENEEDECLSHQSDSSQNDILFSCRCESARAFTTLLSCLRQVSSGNHNVNNSFSSNTGNAINGGNQSFGIGAISAGSARQKGGSNRKAQFATIHASSHALTFQVVGMEKQSLASVDMQAGLFSDYYVTKQTVPLDHDDCSDQENTANMQQKQVIVGGEVGINLTSVLECLQILGAQSLDRTKLCLSYHSQSCVLKIELLEETGGSGGILCTSALPGMAVPDDNNATSNIAMAFRSNPIVARAIIKSFFLRDAINELGDVAGAITSTISISPSGIDISATGHISKCHVKLPYLPNHPDIFLNIQCKPDIAHTYTYPLHSLLSAMRGLDIASETCISINSWGMLAIQHQVLDTIGCGKPNFIDFIMVCIQDNEEELEQDENHLEKEEDYQQTTSQEEPGNNVTYDNDNDANSIAYYNKSQTIANFNSQNSISVESTTLQNNNGDNIHNNHEDTVEKSQSTTSFFKAVAQVGLTTTHIRSTRGDKRKRRQNRRRSKYPPIVPTNGENMADHVEESSESSDNGQKTDTDEEQEFELSQADDDPHMGAPSSPQLMYGDTHLEASDDEANKISTRTNMLSRGRKAHTRKRSLSIRSSLRESAKKKLETCSDGSDTTEEEEFT
mmetsp:Transcript_18571/g.26130  ORF Transcript_18571/g.26130 Transcript_18571/m.26130 type:complete len:661 (+) Transcript_18571:3-1985(+)